MTSIDFTVRRRILEESRKAEEARVASVRAKVGDEITLQARLRDRQSRLVDPQNTDEQERRNLIDERQKNITDYLRNIADIPENRFRQACAKWVSMETQWALKQSEGEKTLQYLEAYDLIRARLYELESLLLERLECEEKVTVTDGGHTQ